jgi:GNAT superfamily N-acetyltransferase
LIREALPDDLFAVVALARDFHAAASVPFGFDAAYFSQQAAAMIAVPRCLCLVLEVDGALQGVLLASVAPLPFAPVLTAKEVMFWVSPEHRGRAPRQMVKAYAAWAEEQGCMMIGLSSLNDPRVARFYSSLGFSPCDTNFLKMAV